jgi:hypothetical protein
MDLVQTCNNIVTASRPEGCGRDRIEFPRLAVVWAANTSIAAVGENPTPTEVQAAITAGLAFVISFSNGVLAPETKIEIAGTDTESGLPEVAKATQSITGNIRNINNKVRQMIAQMNLNMQVAQFAWIGDEGRWHGGKAGFKTPFYIGDIEHGGDGSQVAIAISFTWKKDFYSFTNYSAVDADYLTLNNLDMVGTYTATDEGAGTSADAVNGYDGVTGWDKQTYPIIYALVGASDTVKFYATDALRTAGTSYLFSLDFAVGESVTNGNTVGVTIGGSVNLVKTGLTPADKFTVSYS